MSGPPVIWVFHGGALGDFVLAWPLLRAMRRSGAAVTVVAASGKARLAERELGVRGVGAERPEITGLWGERPDVEAWRRLRGGAPVTAAVTFAADDGSPAGRRWCENARRALGAAEVACVGEPGSASRAAAWERWRVADLGGVEPRENAGGPVVLHVGAGSREKTWPLERWAGVAEALARQGRGVRVLAGEVEAERFTGAEREAFERLGGRVLWSLDELAEAIRPAAVFVGCDTGPTHLAAQLGVPTVALFGPTDAGVWGPVGPRVRVVAPAVAERMEWLEGERVVAEVALAKSSTDFR